MFNDGILEPIDIDEKRRRGLAKRDLFVQPGMKITHTPSGTRGVIVSFIEGVEVVIKDSLGYHKTFEPTAGLFRHEGELVALRAGAAARTQPTTKISASGSIQAQDRSAKVAKASRIWVEGIHDAELIERVWGDDLRYVGVVVEVLDGADDLYERISAFKPNSKAHIGVLLDHLVAGSKETLIAQQVSKSPYRDHVLVLGHPFVDVWQAIKPASIGIQRWPTTRKPSSAEPNLGSWKEQIMTSLANDHNTPREVKGEAASADSGRFFRVLMSYVNSWSDIETPLVNAVEQLIDFVTIPE